MDKYFMFHGDICWKDENDHFHPVTYVEILKILNESDEQPKDPGFLRVCFDSMVIGGKKFNEGTFILDGEEAIKFKQWFERKRGARIKKLIKKKLIG